MEYIDVGGIECSRLVLGCMRIADKPLRNIERLVNTALEIGINTFDHADIYGGGACERLYGELFKLDGTLRSKIVIQTKCGICGGRYDLGYEHITSSVDSSLKRLNTEYIDILLLHRPDTLMRPEQIARAFDELKASGKVRAFGVSNFSAQQIDYLQSIVRMPLYVDQVKMSPIYCPAIDFGLNIDARSEASGANGLLEYSRKNGVTLQTYGTMQCEFTDDTGYFYSGAFTTKHANKKYFALNLTLGGLAQKYGVTPEAVAIAWILHHPARMQAVIGTTLDSRLALYRDCCAVPLDDREWYNIYTAAGHTLP